MAKKFRDPQGRHVRVYCSLLNSPAYRVLGYAAKALFLDLRESVHGGNNGDVSATITNLKHKGWKSPTTLARALAELQAMGFLVRTRAGGIAMGNRVCSLYRFTDLDCPAQPVLGLKATKASMDYTQFESVKQAEAALRMLNEVKQKQIRPTQTVSDSYRNCSGIAPHSVAVRDLSLQKV